MLQVIGILLTAAVIFAICRAVDLLFQKRFRSKAQHRSGRAVRENKRYGIFGVALILLGIMAMSSSGSDRILLFGGLAVLLLGAWLAARYLGFGVFYDGETFLLSSLGKKSREYRYDQIREQRLYKITGGSLVIELIMEDGKAVSLNSSMDGVYPFMDTAFAGWCLQKGLDMQECSFYDPSRSWWFPHEEEV